MTAERRIGYLMTHYPRVALTFIDTEIVEVERHGIDIVPFAMNPPETGDLAGVGAQAKQARTEYLKGSWGAAIGAWALANVRHPVAMTGLVLRAIGSCGSDIGLMARRLSHVLQGARLAQLCARRGISHLHAHFGLAPASVAWFATEIARAHGRNASFGFTIHGFHDFVEPMTARLDLKAAAARYVVCISDFTRSQLCRTTDPALWDKFHVIRCGVNLERLAFRAGAAKREVPQIMALGRLSAEKGFAVLIDAVAQLRDQGVTVALRLVGGGPLRRDLETQVARLNLADHVTFTGELVPADVAAELHDADIFCLPSFSEGLPVSIMEAMAVGVPVVTTWISGIPELAVNGETALTVPPARVDVLAGALRALAADPALRARLAAAARARVEAMHDARQSGDALALLVTGAAQ